MLFLMDDIDKPLALEMYEDFARKLNSQNSSLYLSMQYQSQSVVGSSKNHFIGGILRGRHAGLHLYREYSMGCLDQFRAIFMDRLTRGEIEETIQIARRSRQKI